MKRSSLMLLVIALLLVAGQANAALVITFAQSGPNVVANGTGSLNFLALTFTGFDFNSSYVDASTGGLLIGSAGTFADYYGTISGPTSFGSGVNFAADSSTSTAPNSTGAGVDGATGRLLVPGGYSAGSPFTVSATWDNTTIGGLGLTPGTYLWTWGTEANRDSLEIIVPAAVPEPGSVVFLGTGLIGLAGLVRRKMQR